jgi:hypothetical protein
VSIRCHALLVREDGPAGEFDGSQSDDVFHPVEKRHAGKHRSAAPSCRGGGRIDDGIGAERNGPVKVAVPLMTTPSSPIDEDAPTASRSRIFWELSRSLGRIWVPDGTELFSRLMVVVVGYLQPLPTLPLRFMWWIR